MSQHQTTAEADCLECGWVEEFPAVETSGPCEGDDDIETPGMPDTCPECGSDDLQITFSGLRHQHRRCRERDDREDFHADG